MACIYCLFKLAGNVGHVLHRLRQAFKMGQGIMARASHYAEIDFLQKHLADFLLFHRVVISGIKLILYFSKYFKIMVLLGSFGRIFICHNLICKTVAS